MGLIATMGPKAVARAASDVPNFYAETTRLECVALPPMKEAPLSDRLAVLPQYLCPNRP